MHTMCISYFLNLVSTLLRIILSLELVGIYVLGNKWVKFCFLADQGPFTFGFHDYVLLHRFGPLHNELRNTKPDLS